MRRATGIIAGLVLLAACGGATAPPETSATAPGFRVGEFARPASLEGEPCGLAATARDVWILDCTGTLSRLPKHGGEIVAKPLGGEVLSLDGLALGSSSLWGLVSIRTPRARDGRIVAVDVASGAVGAPLGVGASVPMSAAESSGRLWVGMLDGRLLSVRDSEVEEIARDGALTWIAASGADVWTIAENGTVSLRTTSGGFRVRHERVVPDAIAVGTAFGSLFVGTPAGAVRLEESGVPRRLAVDGTVNAIEPCGERVWLSQPDFGIRSLGDDGEIETSLRLAVAPRYLACDGAVLWVLAEDGRIGSVTIAP